MYRAFMAGFSQQAGIMVAQIAVQTACQTRAFQAFVSRVVHNEHEELEEEQEEQEVQKIGFVHNNQEQM